MPRGGSKPGERRGGRQKGTLNKIGLPLKQMILGALDDAGGQEYLTKQALENPGSFMVLVGRVLPMTVAGDPENPLIAEIRRIIIDPGNGGES